jgi:hypothetical protein
MHFPEIEYPPEEEGDGERSSPAGPKESGGSPSAGGAGREAAGPRSGQESGETGRSSAGSGHVFQETQESAEGLILLALPTTSILETT